MGIIFTSMESSRVKIREISVIISKITSSDDNSSEKTRAISISDSERMNQATKEP